MRSGRHHPGLCSQVRCIQRPETTWRCHPWCTSSLTMAPFLLPSARFATPKLGVFVAANWQHGSQGQALVGLVRAQLARPLPSGGPSRPPLIAPGCARALLDRASPGAISTGLGWLDSPRFAPAHKSVFSPQLAGCLAWGADAGSEIKKQAWIGYQAKNWPQVP
jgi:hypothetical protein